VWLQECEAGGVYLPLEAELTGPWDQERAGARQQLVCDDGLAWMRGALLKPGVHAGEVRPRGIAHRAHQREVVGGDGGLEGGLGERAVLDVTPLVHHAKGN
jgi:hypothetical protein